MATLSQILASSRRDPADKNTYLIAPSNWPTVVRDVDPSGAPANQTTEISPYRGPYKGKTFALATGYHSVRPGISAGADVVTGLPGAAATTVGKSNPFGLDLSSVSDFLNFLGWILHPLNWLRLAEFVVGLLLGGYGIYLLTSGGRGGGVSATARRVISLSPAGRTIRMVEGRRMGRHEGQRESARMRARQEETRAARINSANERERIRRNARRNARQP